MRSYLCREMKGKFDCFTTLLPQSDIEMIQRKSRLSQYQERLESQVIERRIARACWENERSLQA